MALGDFFRKYDAVRVDGIPDAEQEDYVRRRWGRADAARQHQARRECFQDISDLVALLEQEVVPLTDDQRAVLRDQLDAAWERLEALG